MNNKSKFWLILATVLAAIVFGGFLGALIITVTAWVLILATLFILPAVIGAIAGSAVGDVVRWVKRFHRRYVRNDA